MQADWLTRHNGFPFFFRSGLHKASPFPTTPSQEACINQYWPNAVHLEASIREGIIISKEGKASLLEPHRMNHHLYG